MGGRRIAVYKDYLRSGRGADRTVAALVNALAERGYEVHVVTQQRPTEPLSVTFLPAVVCHHVRRSRIRSAAGFINKFFLRTAAGELFLRRFLPWLDLMRETSLRLHARLAQIAPDVIIAAGTNECVELTYVGHPCAPLIQMFQVDPPACFAKNKYQRAARLRRALPMADAVQVLLPSHCGYVRRYTHAPVEAIGNAVAYPPDEPLPPAASRDKVIVYVAYFTKDKNHADLIEAFASLKNGRDWELHLYGTGSAEWENRLKAQAARLGLEGRVRFRGLLNALRQPLLHAGICAFPSRTEGFGMALAEAMWCGLPCVGFRDAPGVSELIVDGANGLLAAPGPEGLAAQLDRLIDDADLRERLGTYAARTVRINYKPDRIWQQWEDLIGSVCRAAEQAHADSPEATE